MRFANDFTRADHWRITPRVIKIVILSKPASHTSLYVNTFASNIAQSTKSKQCRVYIVEHFPTAHWSANIKHAGCHILSGVEGNTHGNGM